jgi:ParB-like chromosome segregation protein Spo0J
MTDKADIQLWEVARVVPYDKNAKIHDKAQVEKIAASIKKFGWRGNPIVVDDAGVILAGHGRRLAALQLGLAKVPVEVVSGMSEDEKRAYRLADNRVAVSGYDSELLKVEIEALSEGAFELGDIFDKKELAFLEADLGEISAGAFVEDLDAAIEEQAEETKATLAAADEKPVAIAKALGFKSIPGKFERDLAMFMAQIEEQTGKQGAEAFIEFVQAELVG